MKFSSGSSNRQLRCDVYICNGNGPERSPIRSVIIRVITKMDDREAGVRFVHHEYDYTRIGRHKVVLPINHKIQFPRKE